MRKVPSSTLQQCFCPFTIWFMERHSEFNFSDIYLITFFGDGNFGNTSSMRVIFSLKMFKIEWRFQNWGEKLRESLSFWDNSISIGSLKFHLLSREYLSWEVNVLTKSLKILQRTNVGFFQLNYVQCDQ